MGTRTQPGAKQARAGRAKAAPAGREARRGENGQPARAASEPASPYEEIENLAGTLEYSLARHGQASGEGEWLAGARVVEALRACLGPCVLPGRSSPPDLAASLNHIARDLRTLAKKWGATSHGKSRYPDGPTRLDRAVCALRDGLQRQIRGWEATGQEVSHHTLALAVEGLRLAFVDLGTLQVLPVKGTFDERIATFARAIERLWERTKHKDAEAVITACARACKNKRELFGAERKRVKR